MGPSLNFDNDWQLNINTAVATELMLMSTFLQVSTPQVGIIQRHAAASVGQKFCASLNNTYKLIKSPFSTGEYHHVVMMTRLTL